MDTVKIIECPRDAWQGLTKVIPTEVKVAYLSRLIDLGFRHIDAVSFVAPKYVPQMADSEAVMAELAGAGRGIEIIGIVVNEQGLDRALATPGVTTLGYPYSVSANFRRQNANMSQAESRALTEKLLRGIRKSKPARDLVVYISMAFGNHYEEPWSAEVTEEALLWLKRIGVKSVSLADTVGTATPKEAGDLFSAMARSLRDAGGGVELGVHLHSRHEGAAEKVLAAYEAGCRRFDCALTGLGGCPFAGDELVGNIPTEMVIGTLAARGVETGIEPWA
ncbi:MAG TPA: hydroxymethylglutaryl-CoA lyase, partial [Terriglobia bacterium]|nr:hydroxymethylglutaryl-CoA lyase [Terriglobia bacterium]